MTGGQLILLDALPVRVASRVRGRPAAAVVLALTATGIAGVRFRCSPWYPPFNDVNSDVYVYLSVGNGWTHGLLPYADLYDVKGPMLLGLFGLFARLQPWSVWPPLVLLAVLAFCSLVLACAIAARELPRRSLVALSAVASCTVVYLGVADVPTSFTGEELAVPGVLLMLWLVLRWSGGERVATAWWVLDGAVLGALFWTKYQVTAPWVAMLVGLAVVSARGRLTAQSLGRVVLLHLAGVAVASAVILPFFAPVLPELLRAYFLAKLGGLDLSTELRDEVGFALSTARHNPAAVLALLLTLVLLVARARPSRSGRHAGLLPAGRPDGPVLTIAFGLSLWASAAFVRHPNNVFVPLAFLVVVVPSALTAALRGLARTRAEPWVAGVGAVALTAAACAAPLGQSVTSYGLFRSARPVTCYSLPGLTRSTIPGGVSTIFARAAGDRPILSVGTLFSARSSYISRQPVRHRFQFVDSSWSTSTGADGVQARYLQDRTFDYAWIHISGVDRFHDLERQIAAAQYTDGPAQPDQAAALVRNYAPVLACNNEILLRAR